MTTSLKGALKCELKISIVVKEDNEKLFKIIRIRKIYPVLKAQGDITAYQVG